MHHVLKQLNLQIHKQKIHKFSYQAIIQAEIGQYVQIKLFDKDEASDDESLGR